MSDRKVFQDSVIPLPEQPGITPNGLIVNAATPDHRNETMTLLFSLAIPPQAQAQLEEKVAKGEVVPLDELQKNYSPSAADVEALVSWLKARGFEITQVSKDNTSVYARGRVDQIEQNLGVKMVSVTRDGITYTAAQNAPSLPADVGKCVPRGDNRVSLAAGRAVAPNPSPNIQNAPPYLVQEMLKAYNADGLPVTGNGQTIAILIDTFPADADLSAFWTRNNIAATLQQIEKINVQGGNLPPPE